MKNKEKHKLTNMKILMVIVWILAINDFSRRVIYNKWNGEPAAPLRLAYYVEYAEVLG